jgi:hypothetical protein
MRSLERSQVPFLIVIHIDLLAISIHSGAQKSSVRLLYSKVWVLLEELNRL